MKNENMQNSVKDLYESQFDEVVDASYMCYKDGDNQSTYDDGSSNK